LLFVMVTSTTVRTPFCGEMEATPSKVKLILIG
jgi:hypothetical protein